MKIHDLVCDMCGHVEMNYPVGDGGFPVCIQCLSNEKPESRMRITFEFWTKGIAHSNDNTVDDKGFRKKFYATEDPVTMAELGFSEGMGIRKFDDDHTTYYRNRLARDGDSPKLRDEILEKRKELAGDMQRNGI
jgi:hypothetical protein